MKQLVALVVVGVMVSPAAAALYLDTVGDLHDGTGGGADFTGFPHLDFASLEITDNGLDTINFTFEFAGDILATDWGKYMIIIDSVAGGDSVGNGWGRPIGMSAGADYWIGSWVDGGDGAETYSWDGGAWILDNATWDPPSDISVSDKTSFSATLTTTLASLGLSPGDTFEFDAFSSGGGGGDGAIDSLGNPTAQITDWGEFSEAYVPSPSYTVTPEPGMIALLVLGGAVLLRRRS